jgi:hypothetical protein
LVLGGCKSAQQQQLELAAKDRADCAQLGAKPGSDQEFQCKLTLETQRRNANAMADAANAADDSTQQFANRLMFGRR